MSAEPRHLVDYDEQREESAVYLFLLDADQTESIAVERLAELRSNHGPHSGLMTDEELALRLTIEEAAMAKERIQEDMILHDTAHPNDENDVRHEPRLPLMAPTPVGVAFWEGLTILYAESESSSQGYREAPIWLPEPSTQGPIASPPPSPTKPPTPFVKSPNAYVRPPTPYQHAPSDEEHGSPSGMYLSPGPTSVPTMEGPGGHYRVPPRPTRSHTYLEARSETLTPLELSAGPNSGR